MTSKDGLMMQQFMTCGQGNNQSIRALFMTKVTKILITFYLVLFASFSVAADLQSIGYSSLPGEKAQIVLTFSEAIDELDSFAIDDPARIVLDFAGVTNQLDKKTQQVNIGLTRSVSTVEAGGRTRMVINLVQKAPYTIDQDGSVVMVTVDGGSQKMLRLVMKDIK